MLRMKMYKYYSYFYTKFLELVLKKLNLGAWSKFYSVKFEI